MIEKPWRITLFDGLSVRYQGRQILERPNREGALLARLAYDWFVHPENLPPSPGSRTRVLQDYFYKDGLEALPSQLDNLVFGLHQRIRQECRRLAGEAPRPILISDKGVLGLNPETVSCDLLEFRQALDRVPTTAPHLPSLARAVALFGALAPNLSPAIRQSPWFKKAQAALAQAGANASQAFERALRPYLASRSPEVWLYLKLEEAFDPPTTQWIMERLRQRFPELPPGVLSTTVSGPRLPVLPFRRNTLFVERTTSQGCLLSCMERHLAKPPGAGTTSPRWLALTGVRGIGKTQQALEYAYRHASSYSHVWWVRGESAQTFVSDLRLIATELGLAQHDDEATFTALGRFFHQASGWLLVLDNLLVPEVVGRWLASWQSGAVLATTYLADIHPFRTLEVPLMSEEEGARLLVTRAGLLTEEQPLSAVSPAVREEANAITALLGGMPLAINQAAAYLRRRCLPLTRFPDLYRAKGEELRAAYESLDAYEHPSVFVTFSLLHDALRGMPGGPAPEASGALAADLLDATAFLAPDRIPLSVLLQSSRELGERIAAASLEAREEAVGLLETYSLLKREKAEVSVHAVVQDAVRDGLGLSGRQTWTARVVAALWRAVPSGYEHSTWPAWEVIVPHVLQAVVHSQEVSGVTRELGLLCSATAAYLRDRGRFEVAEPLYRQTLAVWESGLGSVHPERTSALVSFAGLLRDTGRRDEAICLLEEARTLGFQAAPEDLLFRARVHNNLGLYLVEAGSAAPHRMEEARSFLEDAVTLRAAQFGRTDRQTLWSAHNLALCLDRLGHQDEARQLHEQTLAARQREMRTNAGKPLETGRGTHPDIGYSFAALGRHFRAAGRIEEARFWLKRALAAWTEEGSLGLGHVDVNQVEEDLRALGNQ